MFLLLFSCRHGKIGETEKAALALDKIGDTTLLFFHSKGCEDCHQMLPRIRQFLLLHPDIVFLPLDIDSVGWNDGIVQAYSVERVPTIVLLAPEGRIISDRSENILNGLEDSSDKSLLP